MFGERQRIEILCLKYNIYKGENNIDKNNDNFFIFLFAIF